jgi:hypothetical protein
MTKPNDVRTWPGSGFCEVGEVVRYAGHLWRCVQPGAGKPRVESPQWVRVDEPTPGDSGK